MKIQLVYPEFPDTFWSFKHALKFIQKKGHYWRLFFWTLFRRPRVFPLAITLAIMGFHFRQVTDLHIS